MAYINFSNGSASKNNFSVLDDEKKKKKTSTTNKNESVKNEVSNLVNTFISNNLNKNSTNTQKDVVNANKNNIMLNNNGTQITDKRLLNETDGDKLLSAVNAGIVDQRTFTNEQYKNYANAKLNKLNTSASDLVERANFKDFLDDKFGSSNSPYQNENFLTTVDPTDYRELNRKNELEKQYTPNAFDKFLSGTVSSGIDTLLDDVNTIGTPIKNALGYYGNLITPLTEIDKYNDGGIAYNLGTTTGQVLGQAGKSLLTQGLTVNPGYIATSSGLSDLNRTALDKQKETGSGYFANYLMNIPKSAVNGAIESYLDGFSKAVREKLRIPVNEQSAQWYKKLLKSMLSEGGEEALQTLTDALNDALNPNYASKFTNENGEFDFWKLLKETLISSAYGAVGGAIGEGLSYSANSSSYDPMRTALANQEIRNKLAQELMSKQNSQKQEQNITGNMDFNSGLDTLSQMANQTQNTNSFNPQQYNGSVDFDMNAINRIANYQPQNYDGSINFDTDAVSKIANYQPQNYNGNANINDELVNQLQWQDYVNNELANDERVNEKNEDYQLAQQEKQQKEEAKEQKKQEKEAQQKQEEMEANPFYQALQKMNGNNQEQAVNVQNDNKTVEQTQQVQKKQPTKQERLQRVKNAELMETGGNVTELAKAYNNVQQNNNRVAQGNPTDLANAFNNVMNRNQEEQTVSTPQTNEVNNETQVENEVDEYEELDNKVFATDDENEQTKITSNFVNDKLTKENIKFRAKEKMSNFHGEEIADSYYALPDVGIEFYVTSGDAILITEQGNKPIEIQDLMEKINNNDFDDSERNYAKAVKETREYMANHPQETKILNQLCEEFNVSGWRINKNGESEYNTRTDVIELSEAQIEKNGFAYTLSHEFAHKLIFENNNKQGYEGKESQKVIDSVINAIKEYSPEQYNKVLNNLKENVYPTLDDVDVDEEIVVDFVGQVLQGTLDKNAYNNALANNPKGFKKLLLTIKEAVKKVQTVIDKVTGKSRDIVSYNQSLSFGGDEIRIYADRITEIENNLKDLINAGRAKGAVVIEEAKKFNDSNIVRTKDVTPEVVVNNVANEIKANNKVSKQDAYNLFSKLIEEETIAYTSDYNDYGELVKVRDNKNSRKPTNNDLYYAMSNFEKAFYKYRPDIFEEIDDIACVKDEYAEVFDNMVGSIAEQYTKENNIEDTPVDLFNTSDSELNREYDESYNTIDEEMKEAGRNNGQLKKQDAVNKFIENNSIPNAIDYVHAQMMGKEQYKDLDKLMSNVDKAIDDARTLYNDGTKSNKLLEQFESEMQDIKDRYNEKFKEKNLSPEEKKARQNKTISEEGIETKGKQDNWGEGTSISSLSQEEQERYAELFGELDNKTQLAQIEKERKKQAKKEQEAKQKLNDLIAKGKREKKLKDNEGNTLTNAQEKYFENSKARDKNGNLIKVYHGTNANFDAFDISKLGSNMGNKGNFGSGHYLTTSKDLANSYGLHVKEGYVNIENPFVISKELFYNGNKNMFYSQLLDLNPEWGSVILNKLNDITIKEVANFEKRSIKMGMNNEQWLDAINHALANDMHYFNNLRISDVIRAISNTEGQKEFGEVIREKGYDGIFSIPIEEMTEGGSWNGYDEIVFFNSNQFKDINNNNPTSDPRMKKLKENYRDKAGLNSILNANDNIVSKESKKELKSNIAGNEMYRQISHDESALKAQDIINSYIDDTVTTKRELLQKVRDAVASKKIDRDMEVPVLFNIGLEYDAMNDSDGAIAVYEQIDEIARQSGRNAEYIKEYKSKLLKNMHHLSKFKWLQNTINKYNETAPKGKKIIWDEKTANRVKDQLKQVDDIRKNLDKMDSSVARRTLQETAISGGNYNMKWEKDVASYNKNIERFTNEQLLDIIENEIMFKELNKGDVGIARKLSSYQVISHLLNTSTMARNIGGNTAFAGLERVSNGIQRIAGKALFGKDYKGLHLEKGQTKKILAKSWDDGIKDMTTTMLGVKGLENKYNQNSKGASNLAGVIPTFKGKLLGTEEKMLSTGLNVPDAMAKTFAEETFRQSFINAYGLEEYNSLKEEVDEYAKEYADYSTFQDDSLPAHALSSLKRGLNKLSSSVTGTTEFGLGDFLIRYTQVPGNIVSRTLEYSPAGVVKCLWELNEIRKNNSVSPIDKYKASMTLSRALTGSALMALGALLRRLGILTGKESADETLNKIYKQGGISEGKININAIGRKGKEVETGDTLISYDWLQPLSMVISTGAVLEDTIENGTNGLDIPKTLGSSFENMLDLPCNQMINTIIDTFENDYSDERGLVGNIILGIAKTGANSITGFVPSPIRHLANAVDPTSRNVFSNTDSDWTNLGVETVKKVSNSIPGLSYALEPFKTANGEELKYSDYGALMNFIIQASPARLTQVNLINGTKGLEKILTSSTGESYATTENTVVRYAPNKTYYKGKNYEKGTVLTDKDKTEYMDAYSKYYNEKIMPYIDKMSENDLTDKQKEKVADKLADLNKLAKQYAEREAMK